MAGLHKLTATGAKAISRTGRHSDGGGLYLRVQSGGRKSWVFMWKRDGRQREKGLGSYQDVSLKLARDKASKAREALAMGLDPRTVLDPPKSVTFLDTATACMEARGIETLNPATQRKWERTALERCAALHSRDVATVTQEDILTIIKPMWTATPETARIARSHLEIIFDYAKGRGWREDENPAKWRGGLEAVLPRHDRKSVKHHAALDYNELPAFMVELREQEAISARALELLILTATRTTETRCAVASEFDLEAALWTIPGERMKNGETHVIPLSPPALMIGKTMIEAIGGQGYLFPGLQPGRPLSNMAMAVLLKRMGRKDITVHGMRSAFRDWAGDLTNHPQDVAEAALSHRNGTAVERAYRRRDALEKRRKLMNDWARFCDGFESEVVRLHG